MRSLQPARGKQHVLMSHVLLSLAAGLALAAPIASAQSVDWPLAGPARGYHTLKGFADTLPDFVGPIDGSAKLTIFTEGNDYPVLLPFVLDAFPAWCRSTGSCEIAAADILIVTLPQPMIVETLLKGGISSATPPFPSTALGSFPISSWAESWAEARR